MESINLVATLLAAVGYWLYNQSGAASSWIEEMSVRLRLSGVFINWTRALCHAWMLNIIDESQSRPIFVSRTNTFHASHNHFNDVPEIKTTGVIQQ